MVRAGIRRSTTVSLDDVLIRLSTAIAIKSKESVAMEDNSKTDTVPPNPWYELSSQDWVSFENRRKNLVFEQNASSAHKQFMRGDEMDNMDSLTRQATENLGKS